MSVWDNMEKMAKANKFNDESHKKLVQSLVTFLKTSFIGALDCFERGFGKIWGFKKEGEHTENEKRWKEVWNEVRNNILTNGNNQIRNMLKKLKEYKVRWYGKKYNFKIDGDKK